MLLIRLIVWSCIQPTGFAIIWWKMELRIQTAVGIFHCWIFSFCFGHWSNIWSISVFVFVMFYFIFSERELAFTFAICHVCRLSVCHLSVTFVHPTQAIEIFGSVSTPFGTLVRSCPCVGSTHGLDWVGLGWFALGRDFYLFGALGAGWPKISGWRGCSPQTIRFLRKLG